MKVLYGYRCCRNCENNPANNPYATGVCQCVLPYLEAANPLNDYPTVSEYNEEYGWIYNRGRRY